AQRHSAPTSSSPTCRTSILKISGSSLPRALALGCLLNGAGGDLLAQRVVVTGRVVHGGPNGRPLARAWVVLHRVTMGGAGGPIDSSRTDGRGDFTLRAGHPDTTAVYVVSSWYDGIAYFSEPVTVSRPRTSLRPLLVYDTTSTGPGVRVERRLLTVAKQKPDGARDVLELLELKNPGSKTRIAADTLQPTVTAARLDTLGVQEIERRRFARYRARAVPAGAVVTIAFSVAPAFRAESLVPVVVIAVAAVLAAGFVVALRKKTSDV